MSGKQSLLSQNVNLGTLQQISAKRFAVCRIISNFVSMLKRMCFLFWICCLPLMALQAQELRNRQNVLVGRVEANGTVRDRLNVMVGRFCADGSIRDRRGMLVGYIEHDGTIRNQMRMLLGRVEADGTVRDRSNMLLGRIRKGKVYDRLNVLMGYASGVPAAHVAALFFFDLLL